MSLAFVPLAGFRGTASPPPAEAQTAPAPKPPPNAGAVSKGRPRARGKNLLGWGIKPKLFEKNAAEMVFPERIKFRNSGSELPRA